VTEATILVASDLFGGVKDFFNSPTWSVIQSLLLLFLFVFWLALAYWVYKDARRRIEDPWLVWMAVLLGLVPILGVFVYVLLRPPEYLDDVRERELEIKEMEARLGRRELQCPVCRAEIERDYLVCPVCTTKLKQACVTCKAPLEALWQICPHCETPVTQSAPTLVADSWEAPRPRLRGPSQQ
jgi:heme exporter protein D/RNA polymerase subunit RPABC4/transcription elongation factor Spt4